MNKKPNIVLFFAEQWRGDMVGCAGHPIVRTPNLDRMKEHGVYFDRCFTSNPICGPSRCSFVTGWYPHTRGHRTQEYLIREDEPNLFQYLKEAGYYNVYFGKNDTLSAPVANKYLDVADACQGKKPDNPYLVEDPRFYTEYRGKWEGPSEAHKDNRILERALQFLRSNPPEPFCLFLTFEFVHPPYYAEEPYYSMYSPERTGYISPPEFAGKSVFMPQLHRATGMDRVPDEHVKDMRSLYYGMISRSDDLFGRLVTGMEELGLMDTSALMFLADHGNYAGDFGIPSKWWTGFDDALVHVPLAIRVPGGRGRGVCSKLVQHFDVMGTILELAGAERKCANFSESLMPALRGEAFDGREAVFASSGYNPSYESPFVIERDSLGNLTKDRDYYSWKVMFDEHPESAGRALMIRNHEWKYVWREMEGNELYNLLQDPREERNLLFHHPDECGDVEQQMKERLFRFVVQTMDVIPLGKDGFSFGSSMNRSTVWKEK